MNSDRKKQSDKNRKIWGKRSLSAVIDSVTKEYRSEHGDVLYNLIKLWANIVGEKLARVTMPVKLQFGNGNKNGTLIIEVLSPAFSLEVQAMENIIVQKVAVFFGYQSVSRIRVKASNNRSRFQQLKVDVRKELEKEDLMPQELELMNSVIDEIEDEELRAILQSLQESYFKQVS
jgi:hypothetical protein